MTPIIPVICPMRVRLRVATPSTPISRDNVCVFDMLHQSPHSGVMKPAKLTLVGVIWPWCKLLRHLADYWGLQALPSMSNGAWNLSNLHEHRIDYSALLRTASGHTLFTSAKITSGLFFRGRCLFRYILAHPEIVTCLEWFLLPLGIFTHVVSSPISPSSSLWGSYTLFCGVISDV
jgi:hypothetical protein